MDIKFRIDYLAPLGEELFLIVENAPKAKAVAMKIGKFKKSDIVALCPSISASSVESSLKKLVRNGIIEKHGNGRATFYTRNI